jgi:membrane fusion protein, macrolide-specific efflux system
MNVEATPKKRNRKKWVLVGLGVLALVGLAAMAWRGMSPKLVPPPPTVAVVLKDLVHEVKASGTLEPVRRVEVGAQVSGQVKALHAELGDSVKKGQLLVSLDPEIARTEVSQAQATLEQQRAAMQSREIDLATAQRELARQKRLFAADAIAGQELERAETELKKLQIDLRGQAATVARLQADLAQKQVRLGYSNISAPMDGTVVEVSAQVGQTLVASQSPPLLMRLANLDAMTVRAKVPEADIPLIKPGQLARFRTLGAQAQRIEGRVRAIQPVPERSGSAAFFLVLFEVPNKDRLLYPDMTVQARIEISRANQVPALPVSALGERDEAGHHKVTVVQASQSSVRTVTIGIRDAQHAQITAGLKLGDRVVTGVGAGTLPPGTAAAQTPGTVDR